MLFFADDKETLRQWREELIAYLAALRLAIHPNRAQPRPVTEGIPFLGFVVYPEYRRVKRRKVIAYRRRLQRLYAAYQAGEVSQSEMAASIRGWLAHINYGDTWGLARKMLNPVVL
ncbi:MAG: RNA-dependent DNA polymerase, partial [Chloroflexi bacterium]|nr:RNA-dependent DNA polymerase [Chloroflexota bacterium]